MIIDKFIFLKSLIVLIGILKVYFFDVELFFSHIIKTS